MPDDRRPSHVKLSDLELNRSQYNNSNPSSDPRRPQQRQSSRQRPPVPYDPALFDYTGGAATFNSDQYDSTNGRTYPASLFPMPYTGDEDRYRLQGPSAPPFTPGAPQWTRAERTSSERPGFLNSPEAQLQAQQYTYVRAADNLPSNGYTQQGYRDELSRRNVPLYNRAAQDEYSMGTVPASTYSNSTGYPIAGPSNYQRTHARPPQSDWPYHLTPLSDLDMYLPSGNGTQTYTLSPDQLDAYRNRMERTTQQPVPQSMQQPPKQRTIDTSLSPRPLPPYGHEPSNGSGRERRRVTFANDSVSPPPSQGRTPPLPLPPLPPSDRVRPPSNRSVWECTECRETRTFTREADLDRHLDNVHRRSNREYQCRTCGTRKSREDKMREHCRNRHHDRRGREHYDAVTRR